MADGAGKGANPPFATADGKPQSPATGGKGGRDFTQESRPQGKGEGGGGSFNDNDGGGRDFTQESRPQPAMKAQTGLPNADSIPAGGKQLKADPGPVSRTASGNANPIKPASGPFKNLKG